MPGSVICITLFLKTNYHISYMQSNLYYKKIKYIYLQKESNFYTSINNITNDTISKKLLNIKNNL